MIRVSIAGLVGAEDDEIVFVPNASTGINTVLRNFEWREGDVIIGGQNLSLAMKRLKRPY